MEESAYIGGVIAGFFYLVAGARLVRLGLRTSLAPERLLGATFLFWALSYFAWQLPIALANDWMASELFFAGRIFEDFGTLTFALFLRVVFRPQERWARWLVASVVVFAIAGVTGSAAVGDWEALQPLSNPWWWGETIAFQITVVWMGAEGFRHYAMARNRVRIGLCEPLLCNRYLLWGIVGLLWTLYQFAMLTQQIEYERTGVWPASMDAAIATIEFGAVGLISLVFFPPRFYRRWIERVTPEVDGAS